MSRYIDADAYIKYCDEYWIPLNVDAVKAQPIADVVEVVRCKDCKWFNQIGCAIRIVDDSDKPTENDYCSFGERREDEVH